MVLRVRSALSTASLTSGCLRRLSWPRLRKFSSILLRKSILERPCRVTNVYISISRKTTSLFVVVTRFVTDRDELQHNTADLAEIYVIVHEKQQETGRVTYLEKEIVDRYILQFPAISYIVYVANIQKIHLVILL